jgi:hypothetical protein
MIAVIVAIVCIFLSFAIQKNLRDQGVEPLTRGQLRYARKKAREQGVSLDQVVYKPRRGTPLYTPPPVDKETARVLREIKRARGQASPPTTRAPSP